MSQEVNTPEETTNVGGKIPNDLYWKFKAKQALRKESATLALTNAIRLYNDIDNTDSIIEAQDIIKESNITAKGLEVSLYQMFVNLGLDDDGQIAIVIDQIIAMLDVKAEVE